MIVGHTFKHKGAFSFEPIEHGVLERTFDDGCPASSSKSLTSASSRMYVQPKAVPCGEPSSSNEDTARGGRVDS